MEINLSEKTIEVIANSLRDSRRAIMQQLKKEQTYTKMMVLENQLEEVDDALDAIEELEDAIVVSKINRAWNNRF